MSWSNIYGHDPQMKQLRLAYERGRLAHAYLFIGPSGIGKKLFAFEFAKSLLCEQPAGALSACGVCPACKQCDVRTHPDFFFAEKPGEKSELDIETVKAFADNLGMKPVRGGRKIGILDNVEDINLASANSLLKTLEEPPQGTVLILIATTEESQLPTILSRCQKVRFSPLGANDLRRVLLDLEIPAGEKLDRLAKLGGGSVEQALALDSEEFPAFYDGMLKGLADARPDSVGLAGRWLQFNEGAGKLKKFQRARAVAVIRLLIEFLRSAFAQTLGEGGPAGNAQRLAAHVGPDELAEMLEACTEAERLIDQYIHLESVIEQLMDRLTTRPAMAR